MHTCVHPVQCMWCQQTHMATKGLAVAVAPGERLGVLWEAPRGSSQLHSPTPRV